MKIVTLSILVILIAINYPVRCDDSGWFGWNKWDEYWESFKEVAGDAADILYDIYENPDIYANMASDAFQEWAKGVFENILELLFPDPMPDYETDPEKRERLYKEFLLNSTNVLKDHIIFPLDAKVRASKRGDAGRICVIGGSDEFAGPLYFAGITALKTGADLVYVLTTERVAPVIRRFSPELKVYPYLNYDLQYVVNKTNNEVTIETAVFEYETEKKGKYDTKTQDELMNLFKYGFYKIQKVLMRSDVIVIGLGMGKDARVRQTFQFIVDYCRDNDKALIISHHGHHFVGRNLSMITNYPPPGVMLIANKVESLVLKSHMERSQIYGFTKLGNFTYFLITGRADYFIISKYPKLSQVDRFHGLTLPDTLESWYIKHGGSPRRVFGQGKMLAGAVATFYHWGLKSTNINETERNRTAAYHSAFGGSMLIRKCSERAYARYERSMMTSNMITEISTAFKDMFETNLTDLTKPGYCEYDTVHEFNHIPIEDFIFVDDIVSTTTEAPPDASSSDEDEEKK